MNFLVKDCEFNRAHNSQIINVIFEIPPSYTFVIRVDEKSDFKNYGEFEIKNKETILDKLN